MNTRILAALSVASLLAFTVGSKADEPTLTERIDNANADLMTVQAPIPHVQLHARALEDSPWHDRGQGRRGNG